jgi:hypothetical protein
MIKHLTTEQERLATFMSEISERCYSAGWIQNLEYVLWDCLITGERKYGYASITKQDIDSLKLFSKTPKCWILFDDTTEETAIDLNTWQKKFQFDVHEKPDLVKG